MDKARLQRRRINRYNANRRAAGLCLRCEVRVKEPASECTNCRQRINAVRRRSYLRLHPHPTLGENPRHAYVLYRRRRGRSLAQIGKELGISRQSVHWLERRGLLLESSNQAGMSKDANAPQSR
jgi:DNA-binding CsgD family transcriptional regulator